MIHHIVTMCASGSIMMHNVIKYDNFTILMRLYSKIILDVIMWLKLGICYEICIYITYYTPHTKTLIMITTIMLRCIGLWFWCFQYVLWHFYMCRHIGMIGYFCFWYHISKGTVAVTAAMSGVPIVLWSSCWPSSGGKLQLLVTFIAAAEPILHEASKSIRTQVLASILAMFLAEPVIVRCIALNKGHCRTHHSQTCLGCAQIGTKTKCSKAAVGKAKPGLDVTMNTAADGVHILQVYGNLSKNVDYSLPVWSGHAAMR